MLQIRLSRGSSASEAGGGSAGDANAAATAAPAPLAAAAEGEGVTVACPDHLVIADLAVAKALGAVTAAAAASGHSLGRRSRRPLGRRVHICSRCDFPVAIYGRLVPCEHAFCLTCARSEASCYLCEERIQKIQSIRMMDGLFICAAPLCLKSFIKKEDFESHIHETHANLLQTNVENVGMHDLDGANNTRPSREDAQRQSQLLDMSTDRAPSRPGPSPTSSSQYQDRDERLRHHHSRDQTPSRTTSTSSKPQSVHGRQPFQPADAQVDSQGFDNSAVSQQVLRDYSQTPQDKQSAAPEQPVVYSQLQQQQPPNFVVPMNINPPFIPSAPYTYTLNPDGTHPFFMAPFQMPLQDVGSEQALLGMPPPSIGITGIEVFPRPWSTGLVNLSFQQMPMPQVAPEGVANTADPQATGVQLLPPGFGLLPDGSSVNLSMPSSLHADSHEGKGIVGLPQFPMQLSMSLPPPPPPVPPPSALQQQQQHVFSRTKYAAGSSSNND